MTQRQLTPHFRLSEFRCRDGSRVPPAAVGDVELLCRELLEPLRARFGPVTVISGYRTRTWNTKVGGAPRSWHVYDAHLGHGVAADVRCATGRPAAWAALLDRRGAGGLGIYYEHVHVDTRPYRARWSG